MESRVPYSMYCIRKLNIKFIKFLILIILYTQQSICNKQSLIDNNFSKIIINVKGIGFKNILGIEEEHIFESINYPDEIYINGYNQNIVNSSYYFNQTDNYVELIWTNNNINNCSNMFAQCIDITEIDLSHFNSSEIINMSFMFYNCTALTSINLSNLDTSQVTNMQSMFNRCASLISLNLSNFNTSQVITLRSMFYNCSSLISLNLYNFNTSNVIVMRSIFSLCHKLIYVNISSFDTSHVNIMMSLFYKCYSLISINLSNFDTSQVTTMAAMFNDCHSLTSLNLLNFDTSKVTEMNSMFNNCVSLTSLDLSRFNTSNVKVMNYMFYNCSSLTTLNLANFNVSQVTEVDNMFNDCTYLEYINIQNFGEYNSGNNPNDMFTNVNNVIICLDRNNSKIMSQIETIPCYTLDCSDDWKSKQKKIVNDSLCIENCNNIEKYKYEYNLKCSEKCPNGLLYNNKCKCELEQCLTCPSVALNKGLCTQCNIDYYPIENDPLNLDEYINCYNKPKGYYLDKDNYIYKKCYYSCDTCEKEGDKINHNCLQCNSNYSFIINVNNSINCYEDCTYYYYFDDNNNYYCTNNLYVLFGQLS